MIGKLIVSTKMEGGVPKKYFLKNTVENKALTVDENSYPIRTGDQLKATRFYSVNKNESTLEVQ